MTQAVVRARVLWEGLSGERALRCDAAIDLHQNNVVCGSVGPSGLNNAMVSVYRGLTAPGYQKLRPIRAGVAPVRDIVLVKIKHVGVVVSTNGHKWFLGKWIF